MEPFGYVIFGVPLFLVVIGIAGGLIAKKLDHRLTAKKI